MAPEASEGPVEKTLGCAEWIPLKAKKYGLSPVMEARLYETLRQESANFTAAQSMVPNPNGPNGREDSWGCAQIHLPDNPSVSRAEALDPEFAVDFAARRFSEGYARRWTVYRNLYMR